MLDGMASSLAHRVWTKKDSSPKQ